MHAAAPLRIALVNAMPEEARRRTALQFRTLLAEAAAGRHLEIRDFAIDAESIAPWRPHGLIVTGMVPSAASLRQEPAWPRLAALVDFAIDAALPAIWSCLAAHAAVLHLDGIERQRMPAKLSGLFDIARTDTAHPLCRNLPPNWRAPHSRYNDVSAQQLQAAGYCLLARMHGGGADLFAKDAGAPFLFCQGHPEYDADTLLREYRRDLALWQEAAPAPPPAPPCHYLGPRATQRIGDFLRQASAARGLSAPPEFPFAACAAELHQPWRPAALALYRGWLDMVAARRAERIESRAAPPAAAARFPAAIPA